ncbi:MAG: DUF4262 domain-containing protein [Gemmatimonadetes bacterium]|nr:DUF4262 domain-containing protein [Gemmatimonadota bacterium]
MALHVRTLDDPDLDDVDREFLENLARHDTVVVRVGSPNPTPDWAFTVGLHARFDHPEVVIFGLRPETAHAILNDLRDQVRTGTRFDAGMRTDALLEGMDCAFREVQDDWHYPFLGRMDWYYRGEHAPVLQLFWPDREGRFPWDDGFDARFADDQPLLYLDHPRPARAIALLEEMELWPPRRRAD